MPITDAKSRVALGREGTGEAQIFDTSRSLNAFANLTNLYQQQRLEDKTDKEKQLKKFEDDFKYSDETFKPFQDRLTGMITDIQTEMKRRLAAGEKYSADSPFWAEIQSKQAQAKAFAKKGRDVEGQVKQTLAEIEKLKQTGRYNTSDMLARVKELTEKSYQNIEDFDAEGLSKILEDPKYYNADRMAQDASEKLKTITSERDEVSQKGYRTETWRTKSEYGQFLKLKQTPTGDYIPDLKDGKIQIDTDNPAFMDFVEGDPQISKWLTHKTDELVSSGDKRDRDIIRRELAGAIFSPYQKNQTSRTLASVNDNTNTFLDNQVQNRRLDLEEKKFENEKGGGVDVASINLQDYANSVTAKSDRFRGATTIDGNTYRVADVSNLLNGTIVKGKEYLNQFYVAPDGETMFYSKKDKNGNIIKNPNTTNGLFPLDESAKSSLYRSLVSNLDISPKDKARLLSQIQSTEAGTINWQEKADANLKNIKETEFYNDETFVAEMKDIAQKQYPKSDAGTAQFLQDFNDATTKYQSEMPLSMNGKKYKNIKFDTDKEMIQTNQLTLKGINTETNQEEVISSDLTVAQAKELAKTFRKGNKNNTDNTNIQQQNTTTQQDSSKTTGGFIPPPRKK